MLYSICTTGLPTVFKGMMPPTKKTKPPVKKTKGNTLKSTPESIYPPIEKKKKKKLLSNPNKFRPTVMARRRKKKRAVLRALEKSNGLVAPACRAAGLYGTGEFYRWMKEDKSFKAKVMEIEEADLDFTESKLRENIRAGKEASVFFHLKCKGKQRGFYEKSELDFRDQSEPQELIIGGQKVVFY